ncbi:MAG TPA: rod shape-determining protein MreD [Myxococcales bacterium]|nr:rod shape-determining protein MreD [Myxococcales bacterium]HIN86228.1 rod shape-determining protein MreD [Myxococcales bacterium]
MNEISRAIAILVAGFLLMALESPLLQELRLAFFAPDFILIVAVWVALHMTTVPGLITCFCLGFLKDGFVMAAPIGMHMEIFVIVYYVVRFVAARVQVRGMWTLMVTTFIASVMASGLFALLSLLFDVGFNDFGLVARLTIPVALITAPFATIIFYLLDRVDAMFTRKGRDSLFYS